MLLIDLSSGHLLACAASLLALARLGAGCLVLVLVLVLVAVVVRVLAALLVIKVAIVVVMVGASALRAMSPVIKILQSKDREVREQGYRKVKKEKQATSIECAKVHKTN